MIVRLARPHRHNALGGTLTRDLLLAFDEGGKLNELYALGAPIEQREDTTEGVLVVARLPRREVRRFAAYLVADSEQDRATGGA